MLVDILRYEKQMNTECGVGARQDKRNLDNVQIQAHHCIRW